MSKKEKEHKKDIAAKEKPKAKDKDKELSMLAEELAEQKDKYMRLLAEFENARKRNERERAEFIKYANEGIMKDFLDIVDDLERSIFVAKEKHQDYDAFLKGIEMVMKHVEDMFKKHGIEPIETCGKPFDPYAHEILTQEPSQEYEDGIVMQEFQKGYRFGDRIIRTAKVKVAVNTEQEEGLDENSNEENV